MSAKWLKNAVFYEIYPQSFYDSDNDGIGDINGIIQKLDYIKELGCNAIWINPCFDSPFKDAGYDVRDYKKVAPRYGTNEDLVRLFETAHEKNMHILLDLVAGHTSEEHPWFLQSSKAERNEYSDRYIWSDFCFGSADGLPYIGGECERDGTYILNFFKCQPALNYGFLNVTKPWQTPMNGPAAIKTREALKDIMRFWLEKGCDGFRVDMAASLVKHDDDKKTGTSAIWRDVRRMLECEFPDAAMAAEWNDPGLSLRAGYDMDFYLNVTGNGYSTLVRDYENHENEDHSYFKKDAGGNINRFLDEYMDRYEDSKDTGYISLITCNHDTIRPRYNMDHRELKLFYSFIFTMPGVPFLYYGDEIGMRYQKLPTKEGGYFRTGSRTPMQWNEGKNLGFSDADADKLYLPVDPSKDAPTVSSQEKDPDSLLNTVKKLLSLRSAQEDLQSDAGLKFICTEPGRPLVYQRGSLFIVLNTGGKEVSLQKDLPLAEKLFGIGNTSYEKGGLTLGAQSFAVYKS